MSVFKTQSWLFLRNPAGGVEDVDRMQAAGFTGVFCNIGDFVPTQWTTVRDRCLQRGMFCGPWARTAKPDGTFSEITLAAIIQCAENWRSPLIVNAESELQGTGSKWTTRIAQDCAGLDAGLSVEPIPFANVEWWPCKDMPVLPQILPDNVGSLDWIIDQWHAYGVDCVYPSYSSWGGARPQDFPLRAPYGLYTADDCGGNYQAWAPTSHDYQGCVDSSGGGGGDVQLIGSQHGIKATYNRFKKLDPAGCNPAFNPDHYDAIPLDQLKAYDKWCRATLILVEDHDEAINRGGV